MYDNEFENIQNAFDSDGDDKADRPIVPNGNRNNGNNGDRPIVPRSNSGASNGDRPIVARGGSGASNGDRPIVPNGGCGSQASAGNISIACNAKVELNASDKNRLNYVENSKDFINGVIFIRTDGGEGSGFMLTKDGYAATNAHVVGNFTDVKVRFAAPLAPQGFIDAKVIAKDTIHDLAIIKLAPNDYYYCSIDDSDNDPEIGSEIALLGFPLGSQVNDDINNVNVSFTRGYVSSNQTKDGQKKTFLDIQAFHGNSGGPIVDLKSGKIIGVLVGGLCDEADVFISMIPVCYLRELVKYLGGENN